MADLDEISEAIGGLRARFEALNYSIKENRRVADCRHEENKTRLEKIETTLATLSSDRRVAVIGISTITGLVLWFGAYLVSPIMKKLGWS